MEPHWGYMDGEVPTYSECDDGCGLVVRTDRLDLLLEHEASCSGETEAERELARALLVFERLRRAA